MSPSLARYKAGSSHCLVLPLCKGKTKGWGKELGCEPTEQGLGRSIGSPELGPVGAWAGRQVSASLQKNP